jgi:SAM-dependent methyltransferase
MDDKPKLRNWNERYDADAYVFGTEPNDFLKAVADRIPADAEVLCLADGEGRNGVHLAELGHTVTSIDMSSVGLAKANRLATERGVSIKTIEADISAYDLGENTWDCIVSIFFHIPSSLQAAIYPRIIRALKPGGLLIVESYTPKQLAFGTGGPPVAEYMLTAELAHRYFEALTFEHCEELERDVIEGTGHTGHAAVFQLLAKK